jgi:hypothetical protein
MGIIKFVIKYIHPVRLCLSTLISQSFNSVFLLQQISINQNQLARNYPANRWFL